MYVDIGMQGYHKRKGNKEINKILKIIEIDASILGEPLYVFVFINCKNLCLCVCSWDWQSPWVFCRLSQTHQFIDIFQSVPSHSHMKTSPIPYTGWLIMNGIPKTIGKLAIPNQLLYNHHPEKSHGPWWGSPCKSYGKSTIVPWNSMKFPSIIHWWMIFPLITSIFSGCSHIFLWLFMGMSQPGLNLGQDLSKGLGPRVGSCDATRKGLAKGAEPSNKTWDKSGSLWHWSSKTWDWTDWSKTWGFHQPTIAEFNNRREADGPQLRAWPFISLHSKGWKFAWKDVIVGQGCHFLGVPRFLTFPETRKPMRSQKSQVSWAGVFIGLTSAIIRHIGWKNGCSFAPHYRHYRQWAIPI